MEHFLIYILKSTALLSIFLLVYQLLLKNDTHFQIHRHFLLTGIFTAFLLPALVFTRTIKIPAQIGFSNIPASSQTVNFAAQTSNWDWIFILGILYALGVIILSIRFIIQLISLVSIIQKGDEIEKGTHIILNSSREIAPFSFFNYIVFNPSLHSEAEQKIILEHEKIHASQIHSIDILLSNICRIALWFNPLSWWYKKEIVQNLEFITDRESVSNVSTKEYQYAMLNIAIPKFQINLANNFHQSLLKKRILMLNKKPSQSYSWWKTGSVLPFLLVFFIFFNVKTEAQRVSESDEISKISGTITQTATAEDLKNLKSFFKKNKIDLIFEELLRSSAGTIIKITIKAENTEIPEEKSLFKLQNSNGIHPIGISVKDGKIAFNDQVPTENSLAELGKAPDFIINGKKYKSKTLKGKMILLNEKNAYTIQKAGKNSKGTLIISNGKITDYDPAFEQLGEKPSEHQYIWVSKDLQPVLLNTQTSKSKIVKLQIIPTSKTINASNSPGRNAVIRSKDSIQPRIILNGKKQPSNYDMNSINSEDIASIEVLKETSATGVYGAKFGKNGIILITTKKVAEKPKKDSGLSTYSKTLKNKNTSLTFRNPSKKDSIPKDILYVVDGKTMSKDFDSNSITPEDILSINILKDKAAVEKYGKKAEKGVIEINFKK